MTALVDKVPIPHLADFIDPVRELIPAVLDMDGGITMRNVAAIHVSDARH
jgi:hypothetical protein